MQIIVSSLIFLFFTSDKKNFGALNTFFSFINGAR